MKGLAKILLAAAVLLGVLAALLGPMIVRQIALANDYGEAESLLQDVVFPMADEMRRYAEEHGRSPSSLAEIQAYAAEHDFSPLQGYEHEFTPDQATRLIVQVNENFSLGIDDTFHIFWPVWPGKPVPVEKHIP